MKKPAIHEHEFISKVLMGNEDAIRFANELFFVSQIWDDMIDKDPAPSEENINRMMWVVLIELPLNPFYHANFAHLIPCMKSAIRDWLDANDFEKEARDNPHDACVMEGVIPRGSPEDIFVDLSGDTPRLITEGE